uniref:Uncharacterized protein n=1 Tax=Romanomermis culicivorax TaxID=13658 RepID=A0A915IK68_ROMCU
MKLPNGPGRRVHDEV